MKLTAKQQRFVDEYLIDLNATQAAIRAGYSEKTARQIGEQNLSKLYIQTAIRERQSAIQAELHIEQRDVLTRLHQIATADPNQLTQIRRVPCRYCYGEDHKYQWRTEDEFQAACDRATEKEKALPTDDGGYGYTTKKPPHPDCPMCDGDGVEKLVLQDTRNLPPAALALFAGAQNSKDGVVIKMHDQASAWDKIARHLGFYNDKMEVAIADSEALDALAEIGEEARRQSALLAEKIKQRKK